MIRRTFGTAPRRSSLFASTDGRGATCRSIQRGSTNRRAISAAAFPCRHPALRALLSGGGLLSADPVFVRGSHDHDGKSVHVADSRRIPSPLFCVVRNRAGAPGSPGAFRRSVSGFGRVICTDRPHPMRSTPYATIGCPLCRLHTSGPPLPWKRNPRGAWEYPLRCTPGAKPSAGPTSVVECEAREPLFAEFLLRSRCPVHIVEKI